jgi:hypothetical protein
LPFNRLLGVNDREEPFRFPGDLSQPAKPHGNLRPAAATPSERPERAAGTALIATAIIGSRGQA